jgi:hypothetical protein
MIDWLKRKFDNSPPKYGILSEAMKSTMMIGMVGGFLFLPVSITIGLIFLAGSLVVVWFLAS